MLSFSANHALCINHLVATDKCRDLPLSWSLMSSMISPFPRTFPGLAWKSLFFLFLFTLEFLLLIDKSLFALSSSSVSWSVSSVSSTPSSSPPPSSDPSYFPVFSATPSINSSCTSVPSHSPSPSSPPSQSSPLPSSPPSLSKRFPLLAVPHLNTCSSYS